MHCGPSALLGTPAPPEAAAATGRQSRYEHLGCRVCLSAHNGKARESGSQIRPSICAAKERLLLSLKQQQGMCALVTAEQTLGHQGLLLSLKQQQQQQGMAAGCKKGVAFIRCQLPIVVCIMV